MTQATVTTKPDHRGELRRKPLKPLRAGMPGEPGEPMVTTSCAHFPFRTRDCGCIKHPAFPTPFYEGRKNSCTTRAHSRRENVIGCLKTGIGNLPLSSRTSEARCGTPA